MRNALECNNISKSFDGTLAVDNVNLTVQPGQIMALLGPSGCGKTTLLRLIAGFEHPETGKIVLNERQVAGEGVRVPAEQRRVGMVFQEYALFQHLNVEKNIAFGLSGSKQDKQARVAEMLALVGLSHLSQRMTHELSGGQQQRIALARALAPKPDILLLDEPFSNLDTALRTQVRVEVKSILKKTGTTCIIVTHDQEEALSLADEVAVMLDGSVIQVAAPHTLYHEPRTRSVATFVGESNVLNGEANGSTAICALGQLSLQRSATGSVDILIRPESLHLAPLNGEPAPNAALVDWHEFYGHDQRVGITLDSGLSLVVRLGPESHFVAGQRVSVSVPDPVIAFETHSATN